MWTVGWGRLGLGASTLSNLVDHKVKLLESSYSFGRCGRTSKVQYRTRERVLVRLKLRVLVHLQVNLGAVNGHRQAKIKKTKSGVYDTKHAFLQGLHEEADDMGSDWLRFR